MSTPPVRIVTRAFGLLMAANLLQSLGFSSMVLLPVFMDYLGASRTDIGWVMGISAVGSLGFRPLVAWSLDTFGRHPTLVVGTLALSTGMVMFALVDSMGFGIYAARLLSGVGTGALFTGYFALAADIIPAERRTHGLALFGISGLIALLLNPAVQAVGVTPDQLGLFFAMLGGLILCSLIPVFLLRQPRDRSAPRPPPISASAAISALQAPAVRPVWFATAALSALIASFFAFSTVSADHRGVENPALLWLTYSLGAAGVRLVFAFLPSHISPRRFIVPAFVLYACAALSVAGSTGDLGFAFAGLCAGLGHGLGFPVLVGQVASRMPDHLRGSGMSAFTGLWEVASFVATPLLGMLADTAGDSWMFVVSAVIAIVAVAVWWPLEMRFGPAGEA